MKNFTEQLKRNAEKIRLSAYERDDLADRLKAYMEYHPLMESQQFSSRFIGLQKKKLPTQKFLNIWLVGKAAGVLSVFFLIIVPTLAEQALPGETLYPVKVRFNEELRGALTSSPYQKVEWETERLERRIAEAQLLADAGKLTPDAEADVATAIKQHSEAAKQNIASIRETDADEATLAEITLTSSLEVSAEVLEKQGGTNVSSTTILAEAVGEARSSLATGNSENLSYQKLMSRVESDTTRAYEYLNSLETVITDEERSNIERRLLDAKTKVDGAVSLRETDESSAVKSLVEVLSSTSKLISFMTNIDVRRNVDVEDLVPVILTEEEKRILIEDKINEGVFLTEKISVGVLQLATTTNDYIALEDSLTRYRESLETASSSLANSDLESAETDVTTAIELVVEIIKTLESLGIAVDTSTATTPSESNTSE